MQISIGNLSTLAKLEQKISRINAKLIAAGLAALAVSIREITTPSEKEVASRVWVAEISLPAIEEGAWRLLATLAPAPEMGVFIELPAGVEMVEIPAFVHEHDGPLPCQHCGYIRRRKSSVVLKHRESGEVKIVGTTCLADFFGASASKIEAAMKRVASLKKEFSGSEPEICYSVGHILASTIYVLAAMKKSGKAFTGTADQIVDLVWQAAETPFPADDAQAQKWAGVVEEWARDVSQDAHRRAVSSAFLLNAETLLDNEYVGRDSGALQAVETVLGFRRVNAKVPQYQGRVAVCKRCINGAYFVVVMAGNVDYTFFTDARVDGFVKFEGTPGEQSTFRGRPQIRMTDVRFV